MTTNYTRWFLVTGSLYLVIGIGIGMYMGGTGDFKLTPVHAHINLVGFVLMSLFGLIFRALPAMTSNTLGQVHFWAFQIGTLVLVAALYLLISERMAESTIGPVILIGEVFVAVAVLAFVANLYKHA